VKRLLDSAAVMNASADALGHDRFRMPVTPQKIWRGVMRPL